MNDYTPVDLHRIAGEYARRKVDRSPLVEACRRITQAYNNEISLPVPGVAASETPSVANLLSSGIDQHAMRIASVPPDIQCPPVKAGQTSSVQRAAARRRACYGYWDQNEFELLNRKRARWLVAYATAPVWIRPDSKMRGPKYELRSPLHTYPSDEDTMRPENVIFAFTKNVAWVQQTYPGLPLNTVAVDQGPRHRPRGLSPDDLVEVVQWLDDNETVTIATGVGYCVEMRREAEYGIGDAQIINLSSGPGPNAMWAAQLLRTPNLTGMCQVITPGRISLDIRRGQFDDAIDLYAMQAKLAAMEINAIANSIWPDQWLVPTGPNQNPQIITMANGRAGKIGEVSGGTIQTVQMQPGIQTPQAIDRLERSIRLSASIPADFSGESASNVRTARRGAAILSEAVDYTLQEHQEILARSAQHELEVCAAVDVAYFGDDKKSFYVKWAGARGRLDYQPRDIWDDDRTIHVSYVKAGADPEQLAVETGQLVGIGLMSKDTGMRRHPDIEDPDHEQAQIIGEALDAAQLSALQQASATGSLGVADVARIKQRVAAGEDLEAAILAQQQEAQERQAQQVAATAPEAQPGLAPPGAGAEAAVAPQTPTAQNLTDLLENLRSQAKSAAA